MRKIGFLLTALIIIASCNTEDQNPEVNLKVNISGFSITADEFGARKASSIFDSFDHVYASGILHFKSEDGMEYMFSSGEHSLDGASITLVPGKYTVYGESSILASPMGTSAMTYQVPSQDVYIYSDTKSLDLMVEPTCGLALVADNYTQLSGAYVKDGYGSSWDLYTMSNYYYTYFLPEEGYFLHLVKHDDTDLNLPTKDLKYGYMYKIEVSETNGLDINLDAYFEDGETITW